MGIFERVEEGVKTGVVVIKSSVVVVSPGKRMAEDVDVTTRVVGIMTDVS